MCSQLFEGPKHESQIENIRKGRSRSTFFSSQHLKGVERACWNFRMGLGRVTSNQLLTRIYITPTNKLVN